MKNIRRILCSMFVIILIAGCSSISENQVEQMAIDQTTEFDIDERSNCR